VLKPAREIDPFADPGPFREALVAWFDRDGRDYPWRHSRDPYAVLVSEVMLQQTQVATVLRRGFYTRFLERFPDPRALAAAGDDELLKAWEGLGYYRRVRMLREAARAIEDRHGGEFPRDFDAVLALPGVGRYTAGAVLSFAFGIAAPIVDGNAARVLSRLGDYREPVEKAAGQRWLWRSAGWLLDRERPRQFNWGLMELGQQRCRPGVPDCLDCPVARFCATREPESLPRKAPRVAPTAVDEHLAFARRGGRVLLARLGEGRRAGMWRLPERPAAVLADAPVVHRRKYGITRYRVTLHLHAVDRIEPGAGESWQPLEALSELAMPPADRAALAAVLEAGEEIA